MPHRRGTISSCKPRLEEIQFSDELARGLAAQLSVANPPGYFLPLGLERGEPQFAFDLLVAPVNILLLGLGDLMIDPITVWTCNGFAPVPYLIMPPWPQRRVG